MEEQDMLWEMDEDGIEETKGRNMMCWMFHKGLVIGRKLLVAGMIISSAPVVVPPLVVISALSVAVSVPYGIILASYTCSEKLLDKLLPGTSPPFSLESGDEVKEDYGFGGGFPAEEEQEKEDLCVWTETVRTNEEPGGEVIVSYRDTCKYSPTTELPVAERIEMVVLAADAPEHDRRNSEIVEASIEVGNVILMENNVGKGDNLEGVDVEEKKVVVTGVGAEGTPAESMSLNDEKLEHGVMEVKGNGKKSKRKGRKKEKVEERKLTKASDETGEIKSGVAKSVSSKQEAKEDHPSQTKDEVTAPKAEMNFAQEEDTMWQKIDAVRRIVGYKVARQATFMEELKALYLFTGVEPPATFKDTSDLEEVREKLRFLLSVVGVE